VPHSKHRKNYDIRNPNSLRQQGGRIGAMIAISKVNHGGGVGLGFKQHKNALVD